MRVARPLQGNAVSAGKPNNRRPDAAFTPFTALDQHVKYLLSSSNAPLAAIESTRRRATADFMRY